MNTTPRPVAVALLGYGGLLPFVALALAARFDPAHSAIWLKSLTGYGAVILSFVGALHWGFAMTHPACANPPASGLYIWSVVPSLTGWAALHFDTRVAVAVLIVGFLTHYRQDRRLAKHLALPAWYLPLRLQLTTVACVCLASVFWLAPPVKAALSA